MRSIQSFVASPRPKKTPVSGSAQDIPHFCGCPNGTSSSTESRTARKRPVRAAYRGANRGWGTGDRRRPQRRAPYDPRSPPPARCAAGVPPFRVLPLQGGVPLPSATGRARDGDACRRGPARPAAGLSLPRAVSCVGELGGCDTLWRNAGSSMLITGCCSLLIRGLDFKHPKDHFQVPVEAQGPSGEVQSSGCLFFLVLSFSLMFLADPRFRRTRKVTTTHGRGTPPRRSRPPPGGDRTTLRVSIGPGRLPAGLSSPAAAATAAAPPALASGQRAGSRPVGAAPARGLAPAAQPRECGVG